MGSRKILNYSEGKFKIGQNCAVLTLERVHDGLIQYIFTYIAGFVAKFPNAGRINPVTMALAIF